jgi:hypothetical protein
VASNVSFPENQSVNDAIDPDLCSLSYTSVDQVAQAAIQLGKGTLQVKIDIKSAYRLIPVHPDDKIFRHAVEWQSVHRRNAPLRPAPKIFTALADALEWCIAQKRVEHIFHYLDDFLVMGPPGSSLCEEYLSILEA